MLEVRDLETSYGVSQVLFGMTLSVGRGEMVTLLGRNGMGKTTTIHTVMGILKPRAGEIVFDGRPIHGMPSYKVAQAGIGLVPEGRQIFPNLSVREHLVATAANRRQVDEPWTLERVLELFPRLRERLSNMGNQLSGGEHLLLILDEATEGLAPLIRQEIWRVIREIKAAGIASIIVDKDLKALLRVADRCIILSKGTVAYEGTAADLEAKPEIHQQYLGV